MPGLTDADRDLIARARELLAEQAEPDLFSMGIRMGKLEWYVDKLAGRLEQSGS